ncbi:MULTISPECIES: response regulator [Corallococcus]|uniref:response regulator n=1 Tax=Corallococcus TaxID=83461 RepID=UPI00118095B1|nr:MULTISPECIES: response regulator [Corallococcus]NBD09978.1 response regulator [Corallococcus silvisoli]TSC20938.1 response regulator [Corallococcus sp. Z5C101001]
MAFQDTTHDAEQEETPWAPGYEAPATRPRVLIAEDDREMRRMLVRALQRRGCDVHEVPNGRELLGTLTRGLAGVEGAAPDVIITDVRMPGVTGLEALARLRRVDWATPVILITAFGDAATHAEAMRLGAAFVFDKPFDLDVLCGAVTRLIGEG